MNKIIIHWTAGAYTPNATDLKHYPFLLDGKGKNTMKITTSDNEVAQDDI